MVQFPGLASLLILATAFTLGQGCLQTLNSSSNDDVLYSSGGDTFTFDANDPAAVRFAAARTVLVSSCVSCHRAFMNYTEAQFISNGYVVAQSITTSSLFLKLRGAGVGGGEDMPPGSALPGIDLTAIRNWITNIGTTAGGSGGGDGGTLTAAQRTTAALAVISNRCASCHSVTKTAVSTDFSGTTVPAFAAFTTDSQFSINGLIDPTSPSTSWLYRTLISYGNIGTMPKSGVAITSTDEATLNSWITKIGQP